jgi:hypothetical protein
MFYMVVGDNGRIESAGHWNQPGQPPFDHIKIAADELALIANSRGLLRWRDGRFYFPQTDSGAAKMLLSHGSWNGKQIAMFIDDIHEIRRVVKNEIPSELVGDFPNIPMMQDPKVDAVPDVPGLIWRPFDFQKDLDLCAPRSIEGGIHFAECPGVECHCDPPGDHAFMMLMKRFARPDRWKFILEYNSNPLQVELVSFNEGRATISFTMHFNRERPHWFWREAERPIFERLLKAGYQKVYSRTRKDRPDWIESLKQNYGAVEVAEEEKVKILEYQIDLGRFTGFPQRKTLPDWSYRNDTVYAREGTAEDLPQIRDLIDKAWGGNPRKLISLNNLEMWMNLDRATSLLIFKDDALIDVKLIRHRRNGVAATSYLIPAKALGNDLYHTSRQIAHLWMKEAGYAQSSFMLETNLMGAMLSYWKESAEERQQEAVFVEHPTKFSKPITEVIINIDKAIEVGQKYEQRPALIRGVAHGLK